MIVNLVGGAFFPSPIHPSNTTASMNSTPELFNGERWAVKFAAPVSGTLDGLEFRIKNQGGILTTITASIQAIDASTGNPSGTKIVKRDVSAAVTPIDQWLSSGKITSDGTDGGSTLSLVKGTEYFAVFDISTIAGDITPGRQGSNPYVNLFAADFQSSAWSKIATVFSFIAIRMADGTYPSMAPGIWPVLNHTLDTINTTTTPDEIAASFSFPADTLVGGAQFRLDLAGDAQIVLYDSETGAVLATSNTLDKDAKQTSIGEYFVRFPADVLCSANKTYLMAVKPTTSTSMKVFGYTVNNTAMLDLTDGGTNWRWASRVDGGSWTYDNTKRPWMSALVTGIDQEVGGQPQAGFAGNA
jgi:hypothetical protein